MQKLERLGRYLVKNRRCELMYSRQNVGSNVSVQVPVDSDWAGDSLGEREQGDCQERQTLAETHVMFANACCIVKRRS